MADNRAGQIGDAQALLNEAFAKRDRYGAQDGAPRIGIFGNGVPETLIAAAGACPIHLNLGTLGLAPQGQTDIDAVIEPFVDSEVRRFLQRLMAGAFADCHGIVFARDDAPALIAYQYATEWVRQGRGGDGVPSLFLWNLVHTSTPAATAFNKAQSARLFDFLAECGLSRPTDEAIAQAASEEARRGQALQRLDAAMGKTVSGATALRCRNAGRFMPARAHAEMIEKALSETDEIISQSSPRIGVVGSPLACADTYVMIEAQGPIVCDLQPWGQVWPSQANVATDVSGILLAEAANAFCTRISPSSAYRKAIVDALVDAKCDLVVCQLSQTDDTFGWEIPNLKSDLAAKGIDFLNLGFRDPEPDARWRKNAGKLIGNAVEAGS